jgi:lipoate-protein ligase A
VRHQEELLRASAPAVHVAVVDRTVLSVGVGVPDDAPYLRRASEAGIRTARRSSGGTGILHLAEDLVWGVVLPRADERVGRDFVRAYGRLGAGVVTALSTHGVSAEWGPAPGLSEEYCPLGPRGQVLESGGQIVGAAAQHVTGTALLHHGTLSRHMDRALVARLFSLADPGVADRLAGVDERGVLDPADALAEQLARAIAAALGVV